MNSVIRLMEYEKTIIIVTMAFLQAIVTIIVVFLYFIKTFSNTNT